MANDTNTPVYYVTQFRWIGGDDWTNMVSIGSTLEESQAKALAVVNDLAKDDWDYEGEAMGSFLPDEPFVPYASLEAAQDACEEFYFQTDACQ